MDHTDPHSGAAQPVAPKVYRLYDGSMGTEYQSLKETLRIFLTQKQSLEDKIELLQKKIDTAEGHP